MDTLSERVIADNNIGPNGVHDVISTQQAPRIFHEKL
jgi:hypothetical protein